ncbi:BrnT family toxin [Nostocales cyanobacterium LEGE 11386]|nr:BrnT family toxin [Nostocales cyanobacterium LEGE 11386]
MILEEGFYSIGIFVLNLTYLVWESQTVFDDPLYVDFYDPDHSEDEERYLIVGESNQGRLLIVSYTERGNSVRLISAREVTRTEREAYEEG